MLTEEQMQAECILWFWNTYPEQRRMLYANNNNSHNRIAGNKARSVGVTAGVSDLTFIASGMVFFIEMKLPKGTQSNEQIDFEAKVLDRGHPYVIIRSVENFKSFICNLIGAK